MHIAVGDAEPVWCSACSTKDFVPGPFYLQKIVISTESYQLDLHVLAT
jgi:hypothetical protein